MNFEDQPIDEAFFAGFDKQSIKIVPIDALILTDLGKRVAALQDENDTLKTRLAEVEKDAARYQWLRDNCARVQTPMLGVLLLCVPSKWLPEHQTTTAEDDASIDAAMKEQP